MLDIKDRLSKLREAVAALDVAIGHVLNGHISTVDPKTALQSVVDQLKPQDTLCLRPGTYCCKGESTRPLIIDRGITIRSCSLLSKAVLKHNLRVCLPKDAKCSLEDVRVTADVADQPAIVVCEGNVDLCGVHVEDPGNICGLLIGRRRQEAPCRIVRCVKCAVLDSRGYGVRSRMRSNDYLLLQQCQLERNNRGNIMLEGEDEQADVDCSQFVAHDTILARSGNGSGIHIKAALTHHTSAICAEMRRCSITDNFRPAIDVECARSVSVSSCTLRNNNGEIVVAACNSLHCD